MVKAINASLIDSEAVRLDGRSILFLAEREMAAVY